MWQKGFRDCIGWGLIDTDSHTLYYKPKKDVFTWHKDKGGDIAFAVMNDTS